MRLRPAANVVVRTILAVLFGFMSLFHGTVMAATNGNPSAVGHVMAAAQHAETTDSHGVGHNHTAHQQQQSKPAMPDTAPSCYGVGCFIVLGSFGPLTPVASIRPIATLSPTIARAMVSAQLDPVLPPPRIQV
jgi:hypothetical protein